ncbi:MAG: hypothetical protein GY925_26025 [Actinomycetia bacterium]|nr:hypothetical protein [Actinomycetes bacterium]
MTDPPTDQTNTANGRRFDPVPGIAEWLRASTDVIEGLYLLRMSSDSSWLVRRDLVITLSSTANASQTFEADIDIDRVEASLPTVMRMSEKEPTWLPVLRVPSEHPGTQQVTDAFDSRGRALAIMPQADVQYRLAAALAWLYLSTLYRPDTAPSLSEIAAMERRVQQKLFEYLNSGDPAVFGGDSAGLGEPNHPELAELAELARSTEPTTTGLQESDQPFRPTASARADEAAGDGIDRTERSVDDHRYREGFRHCLEYARSGYLAVVAVSRADRTPHVRCQLLPAELMVERWPWSMKSAELILGFTDGSDWASPSPTWERITRSLWAVWERASRLATLGRPSCFEFEFPVPEVADLASTHVTVIADEDVALYPAVLHHDHVMEIARDLNGARAQAARGTSNLGSFVDRLDQPMRTAKGRRRRTEAEQTEAIRAVAATELRRLEGQWTERLQRLERLKHLAGKAGLDTPARQRRTGDRSAEVGPVASQPRSSFPPLARAQKIRAELAHLRIGLGGWTGAAEGTQSKPTEHEPSRPDQTEATLIALLHELRDELETGPHIEMTADDDARDHVAHFHVTTPQSLTERERDNRPVIHGVIRASKQAREDFMRAASFTCIVSSLLLAGLFLAMQPRSLADDYNVAPLAAILLLVPGISVSLLGRVPGDTIRHLVIGRSIRWSQLSLFPPIVGAALLATAFNPVDGESPADPLWRPASWLQFQVVDLALLGLAAVSALVSLAAVTERRRHRRSYDYRIPIGGRVSVVPEEGSSSGIGRGAEPAVVNDTKSIETEDWFPAYRSRVDTRHVFDLCNASLFRLDRPARRFMVWLTVERDEPGTFRRVVQALERTPVELAKRLSTAETGQLPAVATESTAVVSLASTGTIMAIIACDKYLLPEDHEAAEKEIETTIDSLVPDGGVTARGLARLLRLRISPSGRSEGAKTKVSPVVDEVVEDTEYFLYRRPIFVDAVFTVPAANRRALRSVVESVWSNRERPYRVNYLDAPIRPLADDGLTELQDERFALKIGMAFDRDRENEVAGTMLELFDVAKLHGTDFHPYDRRVHPEESAEVYAPPVDRALVAKVAVSAGKGATSMMPGLFGLVGGDEEVVWEGGTILTAGGYASRTFRFWVPEEVADRLDEKKINIGPESYDEDRTFQDHEWRFQSSDDGGALELGGGVWMMVWVRWQLDGGSGLTNLLDAIDWWQDSRRAESRTFAVNDMNLEYLTSRLDEQRLTGGKARYRLGVDSLVKPAGDREKTARELKAEVRRSLQVNLEARLYGPLLAPGSFVVVSDREPRRPLSSDLWESEFSPY